MMFSMRATLTVHHLLLELVIITIYGTQYNLWSSSLGAILHRSSSLPLPVQTPTSAPPFSNLSLKWHITIRIRTHVNIG